MKNILKYTVLLGLGIVILSGCKKLDEVNTNPNNPLNVTPASQFLGAELTAGYQMGGNTPQFANLWMQQMVGVNRQAQVYNIYVVGNTDFDPGWGNMYQAMANLNDMINKAQKAGNNYYVGVGKILMAYCLGSSTDLWGSMPYSQAFQGINNLQPKFDDQKTLYATMQQLCIDGIAALGKSPGVLTPGADDIIYGGNIGNWVALAHGLRARFYLHSNHADGGSDVTNLRTELQTALATWGADAYFGFGSSNNNASAWFQFEQQRAGDVTFNGSYIANLMVADGDPRLAAYMDTSNGGLGPFYGSPQSGVQIMTRAELFFIASEIDLTTGGATTGSSPAMELDSAINYSVIGITGSLPPTPWAIVNANHTTVAMTDIITAKYTALFLNPEVWTDWRRTGLPALSPTAGSSLGVIPRRFFYAESETERNSKNIPTNVQLTDHLWWDH